MRESRNRRVVTLVIAGTIFVTAGATVSAESVTIVASKDNTLYESSTGALSNGAGAYMFAGRTGITTDAIRRAVVAFDVAGNVPARATITSARLTLHLSKAPLGSSPKTISLHRLLDDWGEGTSDAGIQEGGGAPATTGDATWRHRFYDTQLWSRAGGDFSASTSASTAVGGTIGFYDWGPSGPMTADVQGWLDDPSTNFGWILIGGEGELQTARRFDSRQNSQTSFRPMLHIEYQVDTGEGAGRIPDGAAIPGNPLTATRDLTGTVTLRWSASCAAGDADYEVYEGSLGDFTSHVARVCTTGGVTSATLTPMAGSAYYLVVPHNDTSEGSYGTDGEGFERPASVSACLPQSVVACTVAAR